MSETIRRMHRYEAIRAELLKRIRSQNWPPGHPVPKEEDLAVEFEVARGTIRRALASLVADGLLERRKRAGTRVVTPTMHQSTLRIPIVRHEIESRGGRYGYEKLVDSSIPIPRLNHDAGMDVFGDARVRHVVSLHRSDDLPYQLENRLINVDLVPEALAEDFDVLSPNEWLVAQMPFSSVRTRMFATEAGPEVAAALCIGERSAVFVIERVTRLDDAPVTLVQMIHPGSSFSLVTESNA